MKPRWKSLIILFLSLFFWLLPTCDVRSEQKILNIAAASNLTYVMPRLIEAFGERYPEIDVRLSLSSTGNLYSQIRNGAPFHLFLAADEKRPLLLYREGLTAGKPFVYARGRLVLWSSGKVNFIEGVYALSSPVFGRIAVANPRHAPYGEAALEVLREAGLLEVLKPRLIYGENVSQTAQFVQSGAAQAGFIAESLLVNPAMKGGTSFMIPDGSYREILQRGVVLKRDPSGATGAGLFRDFLFSDTARRILTEFGYGVD